MEHLEKPVDPFETLLPLLPRLQQRDPTARDELAQALVKQLPTLVRKQLHERFPKLRSTMDTDDVVQETIFPLVTRLLEHPPNDESHYRATVWLIIRRTLIGLVRKQFGPAGWGKNAAAAALLEEASSTDHRSTRDDRLDIMELVVKLPDDEADLIICRFFLGLPMEEIARQHGVDRSTMRHRIYAILAKLGKSF